MSSPNMKPVIAIAMTEPIKPLDHTGSTGSGDAYSIPNALRSMAVARERIAVMRFIRYLIEQEYPFAYDDFRERKQAKLTGLMERMYGYDPAEVERELDEVRGKVK